MIKTGEKLDTNFSFKVVQNGEEKEVLFSDLLDKKTIVSVYMKNNTPSCDNQVTDLAEHTDWFEEHGFNLLAISKDGCRGHMNYAKKHSINFTLASDPDYKFSAATDSIIEKKMYGKTYEGPSRSAFVIDTDGTILATVEKIDTKAHAEELKALVSGL